MEPGRQFQAHDSYCIRCMKENIPSNWLCDRSKKTDNGPDHDADLSRYEGTCLRCCDHNHG